jgi:hypothetical protein
MAKPKLPKLRWLRPQQQPNAATLANVPIAAEPIWESFVQTPALTPGAHTGNVFFLHLYVA